MGDGVVGVAARERVPIRIGHMTSDYSYGAAVREQAPGHGLRRPSRGDPLPGLAAPESQIALPILSGGRMLGVLFAESPSRCGSATTTRTRSALSPAGSAS